MRLDVKNTWDSYVLNVQLQIAASPQSVPHVEDLYEVDEATAEPF